MTDFPIELTRSVRFNINLGGKDRPQTTQRHNTFAGWPSMTGIGAHYEIEVACRGRPDLLTGYLMNISEIDKAVREHAIPIIRNAVAAHHAVGPGEVLGRILPALHSALDDSIARVTWRLSPYYWVAMNAAHPDRVLISQQFEFSASHRLHLDSLDETRNRELFGKCNNPSGHGHNYIVEPQVSVALDGRALDDPRSTVKDSKDSRPTARSRQPFTLAVLERIVDQTIIQRFDHKNLNVDAPEFSHAPAPGRTQGVNPSVENIAKVCYDLLQEPIAQAGGKLERITIWETQKTKCTYPA